VTPPSPASPTTPSTTSTSVDALRAGDLVAVIRSFRDALAANRAAVNRLNVYPVPDGDTGTNMSLTLESVVTELDTAAAKVGFADAAAADMATVCQAIAHGSLMGARGNSGVILCQILRGLSGACRERDTVGPDALAAALTAASTAAYGAVMKPIEGTILTVVRCAAEGAADAAHAGGDLVAVLHGARNAVAAGLAQTPEMLPVLKSAGVVDAGGAGFLLLLDAALLVVAGRPVPAVSAPGGDLDLELDAAESGAAAGEHRGGVPGIDELRYEVMYFLEAPDELIGGFKDAWSTIGDSIVVVGGDGLWNCHIHTDDVGAAIEAAIDIGRPRKIRVTDLHDEVEEERWVREASASGAAVDSPPHANDPCETAVVAVVSGEGVKRLFQSLRVQRIVTGGQSMNPSTAQLLDAVESAPADSVVILPNNKNIIPVAEQVAALTKKTVRVIGTRGISEGLAAAMQYDPEGAADANAAAMRAAAAGIVSGEVTRAVRDAQSDAGPIAEGDHLGIARDGGIVAVHPTLVGACTALLEQLVSDTHEIVTILEGEGASTAATRSIEEWLGVHRPEVAAEVHHGGQPLYPYLFGIE
jgi:uncharacterized protein